MPTHAERIEVFKDTQEWIKQDPSLSKSVDYAKEHTEVFYEDDYPAFDMSKEKDTVITVTVDVITIAAPDLRTSSNVHAPLVGGGTYMNNAELFGYHVKRVIHMLTCAASKKADILVLGAFGCGAFQNDPNVVARAYKTALQEFPKVFEKIEFAVYCPPGGSENYRVFRECFEG